MLNLDGKEGKYTPFSLKQRCLIKRNCFCLLPIIPLIGRIPTTMQFSGMKRNFNKEKESAFIMRKQTKVVAVASAAALLAIGASMTSFAATGWVDKSGEMQNDDTGWTGDDVVYYFGVWDDGAMKTRWQKITVYDDEGEKSDDYDYWFNFKSNGEKRVNADKKKLNGKYYNFDSRGVMVYEWYQTSTASNATASNWNYFSSPKDGARIYKGWFKVDHQRKTTLSWKKMILLPPAIQTMKPRDGTMQTRTAWLMMTAATMMTEVPFP